MTLTFHTFIDGAEVYIEPLNPTELRRYKQDSRRSLAAYTHRRHYSYFRAIIEDLKQHGFDYAAGILIITLAIGMLIMWQTASAAPTCSAYHLIGKTAFCLN